MAISIPAQLLSFWRVGGITLLIKASPGPVTKKTPAANHHIVLSLRNSQASRLTQAFWSSESMMDLASCPPIPPYTGPLLPASNKPSLSAELGTPPASSMTVNPTAPDSPIRIKKPEKDKKIFPIINSPVVLSTKNLLTSCDNQRLLSPNAAIGNEIATPLFPVKFFAQVVTPAKYMLLVPEPMATNAITITW